MTGGVTWLVLIPACIWLIASGYIPLLGPSLNQVETWGVAVAITLLMGLSLVVHSAAHLWVARISGSDFPARIPIYPFGDAAHVWPAAPSARREISVAIAGPLVNLLLAGLAFLLLNLPLHVYLDLSLIFLACFNGGLAVINLTPAFPLDGGRLTRAILWGGLKQPGVTTRFGVRLGLLIAMGLIGWGIFLIAQHARFSLQTGAATLVFAGLMLRALSRQPAWEWDRPVPVRSLTPVSRLIRIPLAGGLLCTLLAIAFSLVPTNNGLEAPGFVVPVESMVQVPALRRYPAAGSFLMTTIFPQTPITLGEWVYGQFSPVVKIVPPEQIVPFNTTPQALVHQQYQMLEQSETSAIVVGLRLAGYEVKINGRGVRILSILPDSLAKDVLQVGDIILGLNGKPVRTKTELINQLKLQDQHPTVPMQIERNNHTWDITASLMPSSAPNKPPQLGITIESAGFDVQLPFPVKIVPQKVVGGPSAGLIFALAVYNAVTPGDLTGGWKIAGTGSIDFDGGVGPIGGVQQKVAGAEIAGAEYFLSPPENYDDARAVARKIKVVKVTTAEQAIQFLHSLPPVAEQQ
jgi:PDZ domain-containing protein